MPRRRSTFAAGAVLLLAVAALGPVAVASCGPGDACATMASGRACCDAEPGRTGSDAPTAAPPALSCCERDEAPAVPIPAAAPTPEPPSPLPAVVPAPALLPSAEPPSRPEPGSGGGDPDPPDLLTLQSVLRI